jgi:HSP20 family protein
MDYIKIRFGDDFDQFDSNLERTVEGMFRSLNPIFSLTERTWTPQMDMYETPEEIVIRAEMAGVGKENLEVEICSKAIKIFGSRSELPCVENANYRLAEIQYGKFERILYLPGPIITDKVSTSYANGFLEIRLAKQPKDKTHKVPISDG